MATLHVRNVPEPLYELLRACAEQEGRSIGAQSLVLLERALAPRGGMREHVLARAFPRRRSPFLSRFASSGKQIVLRAQERARELGASEVTPAHVLLAMFEDEVLRTSLEAGGLKEADVLARAKRGDGSPVQIPLSAETKRLLENALRASLAARQTQIGPEHLVSAAAQASELQFRPIPPPPFAPAPEPEDDYAVVDLEGDAEAWSARLNELAREGWELMQILDHRAVFRRGP